MGSRDKPNFGGDGSRDSRKFGKTDTRKSCGRGVAIETAEDLDSYLSGDYIECLICGSSHKSLGHHLRRAHGQDSKSYKAEFNIPSTRSLRGESSIKKSSEASLDNWATNPKMKNVRALLIKNIANLDGTKHKTKSSIPSIGSSARIKKARKIQSNKQDVELRVRYISEMNMAININKTLYSAGVKAENIYNYARRHPNDSEFINTLNKVKTPMCITKKAKQSMSFLS